MPAWNDVVKGGCFNELAPLDIDWFYVRCASVARHLYVRRAGVGALTKVYGGLISLFIFVFFFFLCVHKCLFELDKKRNGVKPGHFCRASSNILRKCLQALEAVKLVEKSDAR